MRSKANIKGHPIHPMLIPFPIAFLSGAVIGDAIGLATGNPFWWTLGAWLALAGIISALIAAVPGMIDYLYTVPPNSSAKQRATYHMLVNFGAVGLFLVAWLLRAIPGGPAAYPGVLVFLLQLAGLGLMTVGGWLGGTLVYRNLIAVDHRYADAGKWKEARFEPNDDGPIDVGDADELELNQMKLIVIGDRRIVLGRTDDGLVAFDDRCTHKGGSLAGGVMACGRVQCLWHGSQFDVHDGSVCSGPAEKPILTYRIEERDGRVLLHYRAAPARQREYAHT